MRNLEHLVEYEKERGPDGGIWKIGQLQVIASWGGGWDHVSVVHRFENRCPRWEEMVSVRAMFFEPDEAVIQLHPPESAEINCHPYCLHLWRPQNEAIPMPPTWMVGPGSD